MAALGQVAIAAAILEDIQKQFASASSLKQQQAQGKEQFSYLRDQANTQFAQSQLAQGRQREITDKRIGLQEQQAASQREQSKGQVQDATQVLKGESKQYTRGLQDQLSTAFTRGKERKLSRWNLGL